VVRVTDPPAQAKKAQGMAGRLLGQTLITDRPPEKAWDSNASSAIQHGSRVDRSIPPSTLPPSPLSTLGGQEFAQVCRSQKPESMTGSAPRNGEAQGLARSLAQIGSQ